MRSSILFVIAALAIAFAFLAFVSDQPISAQRIKPNAPAPPSSCVSPPAGLVAWWPGDSNAVDLVGLHDGVALNGVSFVPGMVGQGFHFDGQDDVVQIPDATRLKPASLTVDAWVQFDSLTSTTSDCVGGQIPGVQVLVFKANRRTPFETRFEGYALIKSRPSGSGGPDKFTFVISDAYQNQFIVSSNTTVAAGQFYHVAGSFDGANISIYVNGVLENQSPAPTAPDYGTLPIFLGSTGACFNGFLSGTLDEVEIFNRALAPTEIQAIYNAGRIGKCKPICTPAPTDMLGWWSGDGNADDISGQGHPGTLQNGAAYAGGKTGQAFSLDGSNQLVNVGDVALPSTFTIEGWIRPNNLNNNPIILSRDDGAGLFSYYFSLAGGALQGTVVNVADGRTQYITANSPVSAGNWQHVVMTYDGNLGADNKIKFFLNGANVAASHQGAFDSGGSPRATGQARIGISGNGTGAFAGRIDELSVYGRVLSDAEISALARVDLAGKCKHSCTLAPANLVGWWPGDGNPNDIKSGNNGTLQGGVVYAPGVVGQAFAFNGAGAFVQAANSAALDPTTAGSQDAWVYFNQIPSDAGHIMEIIGKGGAGTDFDLQADPDNRFRFYIAAGTSVGSRTEIQPGVWYHVAATWDAMIGLKMYVNGNLEASNPTLLTRSPSGQPLQIGNQPFWGPRFFNGLIDEAEVFDRALSPSEVQGIYDAGSAGKCKSTATNSFAVGDVTLTFGNAPGVGSFVEHPIDPNLLGSLPNSYSFTADSLAQDLSTSAAYSTPVNVCFHLPSITSAATLDQMTILHGIVSGGSTSWEEVANRSSDPATSSLCGQVNTLSPFVIVRSNTFQCSGWNYYASESDGRTMVSVTRSGDLSLSGSVDYATSDGSARQKRDYIIASGSLNFAPGETSKSFPLLLVDNTYMDGSRSLSINLSNPSTGYRLGTPSTAVLVINDNDTQPPSGNPLDEARFFVQQHYYDFLNRYPDQGGWDYWAQQVTQCGLDTTCIHNKRVDVSNAFYYELEFQQTGSYVFRVYRAAFGNNQPFPNPDQSNPAEANKLPSYLKFAFDRARVVGGANLAQGQLSFASAFVQRGEFTNKYPVSLTGPGFVDALLATIRNDLGVDLNSQRAALIDLYNQAGGGTAGRGAVLYRLADDNAQANPINNRAFIDAEYNRAFVATQYFGYLRRDSDIGGFLFWLGQVNSAPLRDVPKQHAMVCSFVTSTEYQQRFSSFVTHSNAECPQ